MTNIVSLLNVFQTLIIANYIILLTLFLQMGKPAPFFSTQVF